MDVLHVQIIGRNGIGDGVRREHLRVRSAERHHVFRIQLHRVVSQLVPRHRFQALTALRQVAVSLHPVEAVEVDAGTAEALAGILVAAHPDLAALSIACVSF